MSASLKEREVHVVFTPSGKRGDFPIGTPILKAAQSLGVDIDSVCGGRGICGRCQITQAKGNFAKHNINSIPENISPISETEKSYKNRPKRTLLEGRRPNE